MQSFRRRSATVTALKWTGDNIDELMELCPEALTRLFDPDLGRDAAIPENGVHRLCKPCHWVVKHEAGRYAVLTESEFRREYE